MASKVKCTCGHSWNKSDSSKKDVNVCHVCGKDNTMKNGGWLDNYGKADNANDSDVSLPEDFNGLSYDTTGRDYSSAWGGQFQQGGSIPGSVGFTYARTGDIPSNGKYAKKTMASAQSGITTVSTSSPEYKELYENRQLGRWSEQNQAYNLPDLPEFTVTGSDLRGVQGVENMRASFAKNALGVMGSSQTVPMDYLTGKQQTPSEAWGFQQPGGWLDSPKSFGKNLSNFGMDAFLDPMNLVGVGVADDIARTTIKNLGKKSSNNFYEIIDSPSYRELQDYDPDYAKSISEQIKSGNTWLKDWFSNPATQKKMQELDFNKDPKVRQNIEDFMSGKNIVKGDTDQFNFSGSEAGVYSPSKNRAVVDVMNPIFFEGKFSIPSTTVHEGTHLLSRGDLAYGNEANNLVRDIFASDDFLYDLTKKSAGRSKMFDSPEVHARIMQLRKNYGISPDQEVSKELVDKIIEDGISSKTPVAPSFFKQIENKDAFKKAFNSLPALAPVLGTASIIENSEKKKNGGNIPQAQNGQEMKFYQERLDWKPKSMQDGGTTEKSWLGKAKQFIAEEISDPLTTKGLLMLNDLKPLTNEQIYKTVRPTDYPNFFKLPGHAYNYLMGNESNPIVDQYGNPHISEEFYSTAMGLNNESKFLKESEYIPSNSKNPDANYYSIRDIIDQDKVFELTRNLKAGQKLPVNGLDQILKEEWLSEYGNSKVDEKDKSFKKFSDLDPLQRFTLQKSNDNSYVSMYDKYDFDNPAINRLLHPVEVYDRFYRNKPKSKLLPSSPSKKKEGGVIKDNQGYWNPENHGKVVEIDSNNITMQGVNQSLLGVSNTGDTKLMKPGKNYKFKGEKVTEYPIARLGINDLDAQPMKKLNQLTNFTNNPDKNNWLDKYN